MRLLKSAARQGCLCRCFYLINWSDTMLPNFWFAWNFNMLQFPGYNFQALIYFWSLASSSWQERRVKQSLCGACGELSEMGGWPFSYMSWTPVVNPVPTPKPTNSEAIFSGSRLRTEALAKRGLAQAHNLQTQEEWSRQQKGDPCGSNVQSSKVVLWN